MLETLLTARSTDATHNEAALARAAEALDALSMRMRVAIDHAHAQLSPLPHEAAGSHHTVSSLS